VVLLGSILLHNEAFNLAAEVIDSTDFTATRTAAFSTRWSSWPSVTTRSIS
jgi:hypothetical protein